MRQKKAFYLLGTLLPLVLFSFFIYRQNFKTSSFSLEEVSNPLPFYDKWEVKALKTDELLNAFNQSYHYLGKGAQSFVFESHDGEYVIKLFKFKHFRLNWLQSLIPEIGFLKTWKINKLAEKSKRVEKVFDAYKLAFELHREESALLFLHLNETDKNLPLLNLYDPSGKKMALKLDKTPFILQRKVEIARSYFDRLFKLKKIKEAKEKISQILELYLSEYAKGIYDHDHKVMYNLGFINDRPIHLDVGKLYLDETIKNKENSYLDLVKVGWKIREYMLNRFPEYEREITAHLNTTIGEAFKKPLDYDTLDGSILWKRRT